GAIRLCREIMAERFDLERGPVSRAVLLRLTPEHYILSFTVLHLVFDFQSLGILSREVVLLYEAFIKGQPSPLPELPVQYADFAVWQREWLRGEVREAHVSFWKQFLEGSPNAVLMPADNARPARQTFR